MNVYLKPDFPAWFALVDADGLDDGPFNRDDMVPSEDEGFPWVIAGDGSPHIFRLIQQDGNLLTLERPTWPNTGLEQFQLRIEPLEWDSQLEKWVRAAK